MKLNFIKSSKVSVRLKIFTFVANNAITVDYNFNSWAIWSIKNQGNRSGLAVKINPRKYHRLIFKLYVL